MKSGFSSVCVSMWVCLEPSLDLRTTSVIQTPWRPLMCGVASCVFKTHICTATPSLQERVCVWEICLCASALSYVSSDVCAVRICDIWACVHICRCVCRGVNEWGLVPSWTECCVFCAFVWQIDVRTDGGWWTYEFHFTLYVLTWQQC